MLNELVEVIANGTKSIDGLLTSRAEELKFDPNSGRVAFWAEEKELQVNISEIQVISKALSRSCIKLALLCKARPSEADLNSLLEELGLQINTLLTKYFQLLNLSYADCLFSTVSRMIRTLIVHIQELLQTIGTIQQTGNNDAMNYIAGMINDISQETSKIPMSNKVAYRRLFMETCLSMKDTIQEFKCYLDEAYEKRQNQDDESGITEQLDSKLHVTTHNKHCTKGNDCSTKEKEEKEDNEEEEEEEEEDGERGGGGGDGGEEDAASGGGFSSDLSDEFEELLEYMSHKQLSIINSKIQERNRAPHADTCAGSDTIETVVSAANSAQEVVVEEGKE